MRREVLRSGLRVLGRARQVRERFYAVAAERKVTNPAVKEIVSGRREPGSASYNPVHTTQQTRRRMGRDYA